MTAPVEAPSILDDFPVPDHRASEDPPKLKDRIFKPTTERMTRGRKTSTEELAGFKVKKPAPEYRKNMFVGPVTELYGGIAFVTMPFKPAIATAIADQAEKCAEAWDYAAKENEHIRRFLGGMLTASVYGKLFAAHLPIIVAAMAENPKVQERMARMMMQPQETEENA